MVWVDEPRLIEFLRGKYEASPAVYSPSIQQLSAPTDDITNESPEHRISVAVRKVCLILSRFLPGWFFDVFDESLVDDLFSIAKEEGGRIWWLRLTIAASGFVVKFAWRRFDRRSSNETSGRPPSDRDDE